MTPSESPTERAMPPCAIDIVIESPLWGGSAVLEPWVRRAVEAALPPDRGPCELAIVLADDRAIRALNARFRGRDAPTNVLSFPAPRAPAFPPPASGSAPVPLGDIVLAFETVNTEAGAQGKEFIHHATHLIVHGVLHLIGYDHQSDAEAEAMESRERAILQRLDMPDPYEERAGTPSGERERA